MYSGASVAQRFLTYGNYVLDNKPTGAPITIDPNTDQLIDPTTYLILKDAYYNKATRAYADEWAINILTLIDFIPDFSHSEKKNFRNP
jgi:hypothetical protein